MNMTAIVVGDTSFSVGYVGLGNMGGALAKRLQCFHPLHVFDLNPTAVQRCTDMGASPCDTLDALASKCQVIFLCLPTSNHVETAIFGEHGLSRSLRHGTVLIDQSTGDPQATRIMAQKLAKHGVLLIDAPVSGGIQGAQNGTISIMVGGEKSVYDYVAPLLNAMSTNVFHVGEIGAGQSMKLVNNLLSGAQRLLTMEAVALASKCGISPEQACDVLLSGGARNLFLEKFMSTQVIKGELDTGFTLGLMHKDVRLACQMASEAGVPLFFGQIAREFYQMCINERGAQDHVHSAALVFDRLANTHVVPE